MTVMDENFVDATSKTTGVYHRIPRIWLDDPILGRDFELTPVQKALDGEPAARPDKSWTVKLLQEFAAGMGLDTAGAHGKAALLDTISTALGTTTDTADTAAESPDETSSGDTMNPDANQASDETPDTGDNEEN